MVNVKVSVKVELRFAAIILSSKGVKLLKAYSDNLKLKLKGGVKLLKSPVRDVVTAFRHLSEFFFIIFLLS